MPSLISTVVVIPVVSDFSPRRVRQLVPASFLLKRFRAAPHGVLDPRTGL